MNARCLFVLSLVVVAALSGCAAPVTKRVSVDSGAQAREQHIQQVLAVKSTFELEMRLMTVGYAVLKGAASECGSKITHRLGFQAVKRGFFKEELRPVAAEALQLDDALRVLAVFKGSAAEEGGMQIGDVIVDEGAWTSRAKEAQVEGSAARNDAFEMMVLRKGQTVPLLLKYEPVCDYPLTLSPGNEVNAYADGKKIFITKGMMRFASEDRELAMVIGHELGHNTMGHLDKKKTNVLLGALVDGLAAAYRINTQSAFSKAGASAYSQDFEAEADYVGLYYLARAGYETAGAANFWRRMAAENPGSIKNTHSASHPATTERFLALELVSSEVKGKQAAGASLVPDRVK